ncbi:MAG: hypothetical protein K0R94_974 [Burkholderiales bacterium]|jgi:hypothetical protein|nr:hypothetical protein [Burkholderiales bacterium]
MRSFNKGITVIDSMFALVLLGSAIIGFNTFMQTDFRHKNAKQLASETEVYAEIFAKYMNDHFTDLVQQSTSQNMVILNPGSLGTSWPQDVAESNLFRQIPCVTIVKNPATGNLEALLYYVGGKYQSPGEKRLLVNEAAMILGNKGGILAGGVVRGNSGWSIQSGSQFLAGADQCGGSVAENSLAVNIDLLTNWNQTTQPYTSITKAIDPGDPTVPKTLPGHLINSNTSKANINFSDNTGVILDNSNPDSPVKFHMGYGAGSHQAALSVDGARNVTTLVADTIQAYQRGRIGDPCQSGEIGKTIVDAGAQSSDAYQLLARDTLVCTQNAMLCGENASCYLPSITNSIKFQNNSVGIQNSAGNFKCPPAIPFATSVSATGGGSSSVSPLSKSIAGYTVTMGYTLTTSNAIITSVTCSNMPVYTVN